MKYILSRQASSEENTMNRKERKTHKLLQRKNEEAKSGTAGLCGVGKCAENIPQKGEWDTPNGKMGHPKKGNGTFLIYMVYKLNASQQILMQKLCNNLPLCAILSTFVHK